MTESINQEDILERIEYAFPILNGKVRVIIIRYVMLANVRFFYKYIDIF